jgi:hypothetical protein
MSDTKVGVVLYANNETTSSGETAPSFKLSCSLPSWARWRNACIDGSICLYKVTIALYGHSCPQD